MCFCCMLSIIITIWFTFLILSANHIVNKKKNSAADLKDVMKGRVKT